MDWPAALSQLSIGGWAAHHHDGHEALQYARQLGLDLSLMWARHLEHGQLGPVVLIVPQAGRTGLLFTSPVMDMASAGELSQVIDEACRGAPPQRVALAQGLVPPDDALSIAAMERAGFKTLARLSYMQCRVPRQPPEIDESADVVFQMYQPALHSIFERLLLESYEQTLDCPDLRGVRQIGDVIEGHRAVGSFDPRMWTLAEIGGKPAGVLLLNPVPPAECVELVYLGLAPEFRRRGLARALLRRAMHQCAAYGHRLITLAVDDRNTPAVMLYEQFGFRMTMKRLALIRAISEIPSPAAR